MLRPGNAGSFTASDHLLVLDAAIAQIPAAWRSDVLVTIDAAGASHDVIDHLTALNTAVLQGGGHGKRGRRVEYSIGWPVDERTQGALQEVRERDWATALGADGKADPDAHVVDLTGILRHGPDGDRMSGWPKDVRVIARRVPRPAGEQAKLGAGRLTMGACSPARRGRSSHGHRALRHSHRHPWDRLRPRLSHRAALLDHDGELPIKHALKTRARRIAVGDATQASRAARTQKAAGISDAGYVPA